MNNKRGQTHLEVIIATVLFIGFIFVLLYIIKPFEVKGGSASNVELLLTTIPEYLRANLTEVGIKVTGVNPSSSCFSVPLGLGRIKTYRVTSNKEELTGSIGTSNNVIIQGSNGFYNIYQWEDFEEETISTSCQSVNDYTLASSRKINALSYKKILELNKTYNEDYDLTKSYLGISGSSDWGMIIVDDLGREIIRTLRTPRTQININVKETSTIMIYKNGTIQNVRVRIYSY